MIKYWIVKPECYDYINREIGCSFMNNQINNMKNICKNGVYIKSESNSVHSYNNIDMLSNQNSEKTWMFQYELSLKSIRKRKLEKLNICTK